MRDNRLCGEGVQSILYSPYQLGLFCSVVLDHYDLYSVAVIGVYDQCGLDPMFGSAKSARTQHEEGTWMLDSR